MEVSLRSRTLDIFNFSRSSYREPAIIGAVLLRAVESKVGVHISAYVVQTLLWASAPPVYTYFELIKKPKVTMEGVAAAASVVGIISLGIQLSQILQEQLDSVQNADERLVRVVIELHATADALESVQDLILADHSQELFNEVGRAKISNLLSYCNRIFRNVVVLVAKAGTAVLASVDAFQRKLQKLKSFKEKQAVELEIELSNLEYLMWPWRQAKIDQYIADLDRLKGRLLLILAVANLAKRRSVLSR